MRQAGDKAEKNRVDIGVRVELPAEIFKHITDDVYESKIVYKTDKYNDIGQDILYESIWRGGG